MNYQHRYDNALRYRPMAQMNAMEKSLKHFGTNHTHAREYCLTTALGVLFCSS